MAHSSAREYPWSRLDSDNLTGLEELTEKALLAATKQRYSANLIYTDVGDILVAVNPFQELQIYDEAWSIAYSCPDVSTLAPHIYRVAASAFNAMMLGKKDQVCVISGESGAGKTESAKFIMYQVMKMCRSAGLGRELQEKITQLNPILEAFGNASTALNDNSSRFGKYIQLIFDPNGRIVGAGLEQYLLEKSRVCVQGEMERNFHIFYYLFAGLQEEKKKKLQLKTPTEHRYLKNHPNVLQDCSSESNKQAFKSVIRGMLNVGFEEEEVVSVVALLAGIILTGDIEFRGADGGEDNARVKNRMIAKAAAQVLELESVGELCFALTTLRTETRGEKVDKKYTCTKAADVRDALAKAVYARMFQWIVTRLNGHLQPFVTSDQLNIGILDIFGFENLERQNSFEQFCINLANEQLQCYFNHQIFAMEKMELEKEGIDVLEIRFTDNKPVLDLYLTRPIGLLSLLDEQCRGFNGTERAFVHRCKESFGSHANYLPHKGNALVFSIRHYAGDVKYVAEGFLEKNKDTLPDTLVDTVKNSSMRLLRTLFRRPPSDSTLRRSTLRKSQKSMIRSMSGRKSLKSRGGGQKKLLTVGAHFRQNLDLLMERVFSASPHFVRCIKPNREKKAFLCDYAFMIKQLRYTGMLEAVRVRREGYAYRPFFSDFFNRYRGLAFHFTDPKKKGTIVACSEILNKIGLSGWRMGQSRVFLRYYHKEKLQLMLKDMDDKAVLIQKTLRGYLSRKWTIHLRKTQKNERLYLSGFMSQISQHGKELFPKLTELYKVDILSAKERFGHLWTRKPTASASSPSKHLEGLSVKEKNLKKAQAFGVKLVPTFKIPPPPTQPPKEREELQITASLSHPNFRQQLPNGRAQASLRERDLASSYRNDKLQAFAQVSIQQEQSNKNQLDISSPFYRPSYKDRHKAFADLQASMHLDRPTREPDESYSRARSKSDSDRQRFGTQISTQQVQSTRDLTESYSRSHLASNSSVVVAQPGASQLTQVGQHVFMMSVVEGEPSSKSQAAKSSARKIPPPRPAKTTGRSFFASRRNQKKISAQYEAAVEQKGEVKPEKKSSRFTFKFPGFGRGRVKELKAQMEQTASAPQEAEKTTLPKPKRPPPIVKPKTYGVPQKGRAPPPRERAPPPPSEPAPPPPTESKTSPYHHQRSAESQRSPYHPGTKESKTSPYHNEGKQSKPSPYPHGKTESKVTPYHHGGRESNIPSPYPQGKTDSKISSYHHGGKESNIPSPYYGATQKSPKHQQEGKPLVKVPPPTVPKTYVSKLPRRTQATPSEVAAVNNSMSLYMVEEYLVPVRSQPQSDAAGSSGEEEHPPSPKTQTPSSANFTPKLQSSFSAKKLAASSTLSLDSIAEEKEEKSPSPPPAQPTSELTPPTNVENRLLSPKVISPGVPRYNRLEPITAMQSALPKPTYATTGSSRSLDSVLQDYAPSSLKIQLSRETNSFSNEQKDTQLPSISLSTGQSTLADSSASSMSLDSILEEFSKMSNTQAEDPQKLLFGGETSFDVATSKTEAPVSEKVLSPNSSAEKILTSAISTSDVVAKSPLSNVDEEKCLTLVSSKVNEPATTRKLSLTSAIAELEAEERALLSFSDGEVNPNKVTSKIVSPVSTNKGEINLSSASTMPKVSSKMSVSSEISVSVDIGGDAKPLEEKNKQTTEPHQPVSKQNSPQQPSIPKRNPQRQPLIQRQISSEQPAFPKQNSQRQIPVPKQNSQQQPPIPKPRRNRERLSSNSELTSSVPAPVPQNLVKLQVLATSEGNLVDEVPVRDLNNGSSSTGQRRTSNASNSRSSAASKPLRDDKTHQRKQKRSSKKDRHAVRRGSSSSESGDNTITPAASAESLDNVDWDVVILGFYPHLNHVTVHDFLLGYPSGTYAIYKENISNEPLNVSSNFGLAVSLGRRGIKQFTIVCSTSEDGQVSYQLANFPEVKSDKHDNQDDESLSFFELQTLIDYYKFSELSPGLLLRQPRLLAGVYVIGLMKASVTYKKSQIPLRSVVPTRPHPPALPPATPPVVKPLSLSNGILPVNDRIYGSVDRSGIPTRTKTPNKKRREYEVVW